MRTQRSSPRILQGVRLSMARLGSQGSSGWRAWLRRLALDGRRGQGFIFGMIRSLRGLQDPSAERVFNILESAHLKYHRDSDLDLRVGKATERGK